MFSGTKIGIDIPIHLTDREKEILEMIRQGYLSKEISEKLSISFNTVNTHRQNILKKLNANNSFEAISYAKRLGLCIHFLRIRFVEVFPFNNLLADRMN